MIPGGGVSTSTSKTHCCTQPLGNGLVSGFVVMLMV